MQLQFPANMVTQGSFSSVGSANLLSKLRSEGDSQVASGQVQFCNDTKDAAYCSPAGRILTKAAVGAIGSAAAIAFTGGGILATAAMGAAVFAGIGVVTGAVGGYLHSRGWMSDPMAGAGLTAIIGGISESFLGVAKGAAAGAVAGLAGGGSVGLAAGAVAGGLLSAAGLGLDLHSFRWEPRYVREGW